MAANECDTIELKPAEELAAPIKKEAAKTPTIVEEEEEDNNCADCGKPPLPKSAKTESGSSEQGPKYTWRIDLSKTERFWSGWFKGLSQKFLDIRIPKLLLLANIHGLDTALTVGQMQGIITLKVFFIIIIIKFIFQVSFSYKYCQNLVTLFMRINLIKWLK